jgi:hypothetical protein
MKDRTLTRKHLENRYANAKWPKLLILKDKHESDHYLINDIDALLRAALIVINQRIEQRYFYEPKPEKLLEEVPDDVIDKLPEAMKKKALSDKSSNKYADKRYQRELEQWQTIQRVITEKDGLAAFQVMDDRKDHEYEGWSLERIKIP